MNWLAIMLLLAAPLRITKNTTLPPNGEYRQAVIIMADDVTLDCRGSAIIGDRTGVGILIENRRGVTVRNCKVRGWDVGLYVIGGNGFLFEGNEFSGNYVDDNYDIEHLRPIPHGGAILNGIQNSRFQGNASNGNIAGVQVLNSSRIELLRNITNQNRGWGIYLYGTTSSRVLTNTVEYNNRSCPQWGKDAGCGSAGIVLTQQSDRNMVGWNKLTANGDGVYQGNNPGSASNDNEILYNTISRSIANGVEATFGTRNYLHHNTFVDDKYGGWFGYSKQLRFEYNTVRGARVKSIQTDNAQFNKYIGNTFDGSDVLLQPVDGGTCVGNSFDKNTLKNAEIVVTGCQ